MDDAQIKHLEMIQAVIARMAQNSFAFKGWTAALVTGIFVIAAANGVNPRLLLVALLPTLAFWGLDGYYLWQERLFRKLYDAVRLAPPVDWQPEAFKMDAAPYSIEVDSWHSVCLSRTVAGFYAPIIVVVLGAAALTLAFGGYP